MLLDDTNAKLGSGEPYTECDYVNAIEFLRDSHRYDEVGDAGSMDKFRVRDVRHLHPRWPSLYPRHHGSAKLESLGLQEEEFVLA